MATIKLTGGKVVLKDGKASCSCCAPSDCCLYPWPDPDGGSPAYPGEDLPETLEISKDGGATWVEVTRSAETFSYSSADGFYSIDGSTLENWRVVYFEEGIQYSEGFAGCLVGPFTSFGVDPADFLVRDVFPDILTAQLMVDGSPLNVEMARAGLCRWQGSDSTFDEFVIAVTYDETSLRWLGSITLTTGLGDYFKLNADLSDAFNNTPITEDGGFYNGPAYFFSGGQEWNGQFSLLP